MSAGFPNRPSRTDYGPPLVDVRPVTQPDRELGAEPVNLAWWQAAGAGRTVPMAVIVYNGTTDSLVHRALAFDPNEVLTPAAVTIVKNGTGDYTITFQASYPDESGRQVAFAPRAALAMVQSNANPNIQGVCGVNGQSVTVRVADASNVATNGTVVVLVW